MLNRLEIENFQSHKDSMLEFSPGVNLIIGESDNGKSALLRAIYWAAMNKPAGKEFVNWEDNKAVASVTIENDNHAICRIIGDSINSYFLDGMDNELTGFGKHGVPEAIKTALHLNEINFQRQQDTFFLIDKSPGEVGRYLNSVINLEVIDKSLTHAGGRARSASAENERLKTDLTELKSELDSYSWIDNFSVKLHLVEKAEKDLEVKRWEYRKVKTNSDLLQEQIGIKKGCETITAFSKWVDQVISKDKEITDKTNRCNNLESLIFSIEQVSIEVKQAKTVLKHQSKLIEIEQKEQELNKKRNEADQLENLIEIIDDTRIGKFRIQGIIDELTIEFNELMPDECPICGGVYEKR